MEKICSNERPREEGVSWGCLLAEAKEVAEFHNINFFVIFCTFLFMNSQQRSIVN
jgi:hypothetical protein